MLIKDNIEAAGPLPTTAGSLALADNVTNRDAPLVARLRAAGAVILGKTNLERMGQHPLEPFDLGLERGRRPDPQPLCARPQSLRHRRAAAAPRSRPGWCGMAIGTETDGSVTCPAAINGIVGLKPTVGLVSRTHVVPISHSQDTAGADDRDRARGGRCC